MALDKDAPILAPEIDRESVPNFFRKVDMLGMEAGLTDTQKIAWARNYASCEEVLWRSIPEINGNNYWAFVNLVMRFYPGSVTQTTMRNLDRLIATRAL